jgi:hypothetical protein
VPGVRRQMREDFMDAPRAALALAGLAALPLLPPTERSIGPGG